MEKVCTVVCVLGLSTKFCLQINIFSSRRAHGCYISWILFIFVFKDIFLLPSYVNNNLMDIKCLWTTSSIALYTVYTSFLMLNVAVEKSEASWFFFTWNTLCRIKIIATILFFHCSNSTVFILSGFFFFSFWNECSVFLQVQLLVYRSFLLWYLATLLCLNHMSHVLFCRNSHMLCWFSFIFHVHCFSF